MVFLPFFILINNLKFDKRYCLRIKKNARKNAFVYTALIIFY